MRLRSLVVALDTNDWATFASWCEIFGPRAGALKVGLEAFVHWGPRAVAEAGRQGAAVFLDLKLHDIPNTVAGAVAAAKGLGVTYLTVHAGGGRAMLEAAVAAAADEVRVLAVTVLTHLETEDLATLGLPGSAAQRVSSWACLAREAGCAGVVCSPHEAERLRLENPRPFLLATPGIRSGGIPGDDQRRIAKASTALAAGADLVVVGRPLTRAVDPEAALLAFEREVDEAARR